MTNTNTTTNQIALSDITVDTRIYERDAWSKPNGRGRWAFGIGSTEAYDDATKAFFTDYMTYAEAVKVAKREAQKRRAEVIYVLP